MKDGFVIKKPQVVHSRARFAARLEAKRKGRHTGACLLLTVDRHRLRRLLSWFVCVY